MIVVHWTRRFYGGARRGRAPLFLFALVVLTCSCESTPTSQPTPPSSSASWRWDNPFPLSSSINAVHGASASDVFAVGEFGAALHFDGTRWGVVESGTDKSLNGVWGSSRDNVYAVGDGGTVRRFDGSQWRFVSTPAGPRNLNAVWGMGESFVVIVGDDGFVLRYDGQTWTETTLGFPDLFDHYAVWASSPDTIYVVGEHAANTTGSSFRYDGAVWSAIPTGRSQNLFGLFGVSGLDVVAVGTNRTLLHFDGVNWTALSSGTGLEEFRDVWGTDTSDLWLVGRNFGGADAIFRWSTDTLTQHDAGAGVDLFGVWGSGGADFHAVGANGTVLREEGSGWERISSGSTDDLFAIHGSANAVSGFTVVSVGANPNVILRAGDVWTSEDTGHLPGFVDVWALSAETGFAVSNTGTVFYYDQSVWTEQIASGVRSVWAESATEAWAAGSSIRKLLGTAWIPFSPAPPVVGPFNDVWGNAVGDVVVVGAAGLVVQWDGSAWARLDSLTSSELTAVCGNDEGDVFVVGAMGTILHYDASGGEVVTPTSADLHSVWTTSSKFAVAVGATGTILIYDGSNWEAQPRLTQLDLYGVWGSSPDNVFVSGERGTVLRYAR